MAELSSGGAKGVDRAAIFLMSLGEATAAQVLRHLGPREVQKIGVAMAGLKNVRREQVETTMQDFVTHLHENTALGVGAEDYVRNTLVDALGPERAGAMIDRILLGSKSKGLESLKWMDPRSVFEVIRHEHPQVIAIVLAYLDADQAGPILSMLPEQMRGDVLLRIATLEGIQPAAMQELNELLEQQLQHNSGAKASSFGGLRCAAEILNSVKRGAEQGIIEQMNQANGDLSTRIQDLMFVFDGIVEIDDRGVQTLLREVSSDILVVALKGADDTVKDKIFRNMSQRAAEMLRDDLEAQGPVKLSEVETAQKEILTIARRLADEGQIVLGGAGGEEMV
ncbi:MAG: flagellar motor switch protein FliG [Gammaproteobacteria bacterium]|nr:flagellar motor switch protein FliG [Gammaproteobacteria bacterium]